MWADPAMMTIAELQAEMLAIRREFIERRIEAMHRPPLRLIAALDDIDGDSDLEAGCDDDADADLEDENEHGDDSDYEPDLSLPEHIDQERRTRLDPFCRGVLDGEEDSFLDISDARFDGMGVRAARELIRQAQCQSPAYWMRRAS
ncbi:hypothetical protein ATER59S_02489 [Aquamicrobium terrae]